MGIDFERIGSKIRYYRTKNGLSQDDLAEAADVNRVYLSRLERGERGASLETIVAIANSLRITVDDILDGSLTSAEPSMLESNYDLLSDCTKAESEILLSILKSAKAILRKYTITK